MANGLLRRTLTYLHLVPPQAFTGMVPFSDSSSLGAVMAIVNGRRPPQPTHPALTGELWTLMQRCWDQDPHSRPEVSEVLMALRGS